MLRRALTPLAPTPLVLAVLTVLLAALLAGTPRPATAADADVPATPAGTPATPTPATTPAADPASTSSTPARAAGAGRFFWANAWAAHHTAARGRSSGAERMRRLVRVVRREEATLGTLAELERPQIAAFRRAAPSYRLVVGGRGMTDGVFYDTDRYDLLRAYRFRGFTYGGRRVPVPVLVLRDTASGHRLAVISIHNPTEARWRGRALGRELREVRRVRRAHPGVTVFVAGDFNAREAVGARARRVGLVSAATRADRGRPPIDQLLLDHHATVTAYRAIRPVARITDHTAVYAAGFRLD